MFFTRLPKLNNFRQAALAAAMVVTVPTAMAAKVLVLSANETAPDAIQAVDNMAAEFGVAQADVKRVLDGATLTDADFMGYDVVVVGTVYNKVTDANWAAIEGAIQGRLANSFVMFVDACCDNVTENMKRWVPKLNTSTGWSADLLNPPDLGGRRAYPLNDDSPYKTDFTSLPFIWGNDTQYITGVPAKNILYAPGLVLNPSSPPTSPADLAHLGGGVTPGVSAGLFVPVVESRDAKGVAGNGACVFLMNDISPFTSPPYIDNMSNNQGKVGAAFMKAAGPGGACGLPASISMAFDKATVGPDGTANLTITITNHTGPTLAAVPGLRVESLLPAPLLVNGAPSSTCGTNPANTTGTTNISLTGATLPAQNSCTITVPVRWVADAAKTCGTPTSVTATITPGAVAPAGQFSTSNGQVNTPATADIACDNKIVVPPTGQAQAQAVPSTTVWGLVGLTGLLGFFAARRSRKLRA